MKDAEPVNSASVAVTPTSIAELAFQVQRQIDVLIGTTGDLGLNEVIVRTARWVLIDLEALRPLARGIAPSNGRVPATTKSQSIGQ